ncbi:MAG: hypothetical protein HYT27_01865, partial [Parcubacteria group bacterium]|nr:hypothetical protein [Parcubacteria group bacterium]
KMLRLLNTGFVLALERNKGRRRVLHRECDKIWMEIDRKQLYQTLHRLRLRGFIQVLQKNNKADAVLVTRKGEDRIQYANIKKIKLKKQNKWDKKWRMVAFDIPESRRFARDALRKSLKNIGFVEFQKSIFVYPYPCKKEINFLINVLGIDTYVYYIESVIAPDDNFKKLFSL